MPPVNDDFANAIALTGPTGSTTGTNDAATLETGEPSPAFGTGDKTVWWKWTAPGSVDFTIDLSGSAFDTVLEIYTGPSLGALTLVASDDDSGSGSTSRVTFTASAGSTYYIRVNGFGSVDHGAISLAWSTAVPGLTFSGFTPAAQTVGETVVLTGVGFTAVTAVAIGGVAATFTIDSDTQITATVPTGAVGVNGPISVTIAAGTAQLIGFTPLYPGPWISPPEQDHTTSFSAAGQDASWASNVNPAEADAANGSGNLTSIDDLVDSASVAGKATSPFDGLQRYVFQQQRITVEFNQSAYRVTDPVDPLAWDAEFDPATPGSVLAVNAVDFEIVARIVGTAGDLATSKVRAYLYDFFTTWGGATWTNRATLESVTPSGERAYTAGDGLLTTTPALGAFEITDTPTDTHKIKAKLYTDRNAENPLTTVANDSFVYFECGGYDVNLHIIPARFRWRYAKPQVKPPQRQYPRDDGLGISTRRSWPPPTSKQYGMRRGPTATYW